MAPLLSRERGGGGELADKERFWSNFGAAIDKMIHLHIKLEIPEFSVRGIMCREGDSATALLEHNK